MTDKIFYYQNGRCTPKEFKLDYSIKNKIFYLTINAYGDIWIETFKTIDSLIDALVKDWYFLKADIDNIFYHLNIME